MRRVVFNLLEPEIGVVFEYTAAGVPGRAQGWCGTCTECGKTLHYWTEQKAADRGQVHVDSHEPR